MITKPLIISGVPACGKTAFGDWLRDERGFRHLDMEAPQQQAQTARLWTEYQVGKFAEIRMVLDRLREGNPKLVVTWGFIPNSIGIGLLHMFQDVGFQPWWFTGPVAVARHAWVQRDNRPDASLFDAQMRRIDAVSADLNGLYVSTTLRTLEDDGSRLSFDEIELHIAGCSVPTE
jgi:hypothetical protein